MKLQKLLRNRLLNKNELWIKFQLFSTSQPSIYDIPTGMLSKCDVDIFRKILQVQIKSKFSSEILVNVIQILVVAKKSTLLILDDEERTIDGEVMKENRKRIN